MKRATPPWIKKQQHSRTQARKPRRGYLETLSKLHAKPVPTK